MIFLVSEGAKADVDLALVSVLPHSGRGEGIDFHKGFLWESEGEDRIIRKIDPRTGQVLEIHSSPTLYPESLAWMSQKKFIHIDYKRKDVVVGKISRKGKLRFEMLTSLRDLGFGLAKKNEKSFWVTGHFNGKIHLYSFPEIKLLVTLNTTLKSAEDLAWDGKYLWSSDYSDRLKKIIYQIDSETGQIVKTHTIDSDSPCERIDGIAADQDLLFVTGKNCKLFVLRQSSGLSRLPASVTPQKETAKKN